jgi:phosphopantothenoylcysteine decarboxylase/phosphopantothenate--cysteine ligase
MKMSRLLLGITSGIAAFKTIDLIKLLRKEKVSVHVIMTQSATHMVDEKELEQVSGNKVWRELYEQNFDYKKILTTRKVDHIDVADTADLFVIAPDFLTTTALAVSCPTIIFPSMNLHMWQHPSVQENIQKLRSFGYTVIDPESGPLACGYEGKGRLPDIKVIAEIIQKALKKTQVLKGKKILVTFGGTQEKVDDVRYLTNKSSGKMGAALADAAALAGAEVTTLRAKSAVQARYAHKDELFETADELEALMKRYVLDMDILFHVAAVSDFQLKRGKYNGKISSNASVSLELVPRPKIINNIKKWNPHITLIAFKAEANLSEKELIAVAQQKLQESHADAVIANEIGKSDRGFQADTNEVFVIQKSKRVHKITLGLKSEIAEKLLTYLFA